MTGQPIRNMAASVRQRLLDRSRARGEDYQYLLQRYASERFLYRLGQSPYRDRYVLKGAMLFALWGGSSYRPTRDLDFTGYGGRAAGEILDAMSEICTIAVPDDGIAFELTTLTTDPIRDGSGYQGFRVKFQARLGTARIPMQIDIGFGNAIEHRATEVEYPVLLDAPAPRIRAYPQEAVVAEKLHAMVVLGERNSRYKDFYDLHVLALQFPFEGETLGPAVAATFARRATPMDAAVPTALTPRFFVDDARAAQWRVYWTRNGLPGVPADFMAVGDLLRSFLGPIWGALAANTPFPSTWAAGGPWSSATFAEATGPGQATADPSDQTQSNENPAGRRRYKPYPAYQDSGVEWLGEIPAHWDVKRLKLAAALNPAVSEARGLPSDTEVSFLPMEAVGEYGGLDLSRTKQLAEVGTGYTFFRNGDVIVAKITPCFENGKGARAAGLVNGIAFGTTELHVLRSANALDEQFLFYLSVSSGFRRLGEAEMYGASGQKRVPESFVENLRHPIPPLAEQHAIAAFLDHETARIDSLVAKKERLIELLQEKRTTLITQAVTKGLDPGVKLVVTGAWLFPEIPGRWELRKLRRLIGRVKRPVAVEPDTEYREIGIRSWGRGVFHKDPVRGALLEDKRVFYIEPGDFVLNIVFAWEGAVAIVSESELGMIASHRFPTFRRSDEVDLDYLLMVLQSAQGRTVMSINSPGAAGRNRTIRLEQFLDEEVPLPPLAEQREIVGAFRAEEKRLMVLTAKVREAIDRLKEYRTALISAAVTGKINVREEVP